MQACEKLAAQGRARYQREPEKGGEEGQQFDGARCRWWRRACRPRGSVRGRGRSREAGAARTGPSGARAERRGANNNTTLFVERWLVLVVASFHLVSERRRTARSSLLAPGFWLLASGSLPLGRCRPRRFSVPTTQQDGPLLPRPPSPPSSPPPPRCLRPPSPLLSAAASPPLLSAIFSNSARLVRLRRRLRLRRHGTSFSASAVL